MNINLYLLKNQFVSTLKCLYDALEIRAIFHLYCEMELGIKKHEVYLQYNKILSEEETDRAFAILERLKQGEPVQYVLETACFWGLPLRVNSSVLIPRPETEELVQLVIQELKGYFPYQILDVGTGSGAIAIALKHQLPHCKLTALDISPQAIALAQKNADTHHCNIDFLCTDIFQNYSFPNTYDVIVSNPPYIPLSKKNELAVHVAHFEPEMALFVPDDNPIVFYQRIIYLGHKLLNNNGIIFFETDDCFHTLIEDAFSLYHYHNIRKLNDINGKPRFIIGYK